MLIVNADDWGYAESQTTAIARCFGRGGITSATAFVWMEDSLRAAELALELRLPVGLHVSLDLPFTAVDVPEGARQDQAEVCRRRNRGLIAKTVRAQLEEFERLYGRAPTHVDSHHHLLERTPAAFLALPPGTKVRNPRWPRSSALVPQRRNWRRPLLRRRFVTTDEFVTLTDVHPAFGGSGLDEALDRAASKSVELMTHPQFEREHDVLISDEWLAQLVEVPLGSFDDL